MNILIILTYKTSFVNWKESGLIDRELEIYRKLQDAYNLNFTFVTFGDHNDENIFISGFKFSVIPIFKYLKKSKYSLINISKSIYFALKINSYCEDISIIKTNQLMGSWIGVISKFRLKSHLIVRTGYDAFEFAIRDNKSILKKSLYYLLTQTSLIFADIYTVTSESDMMLILKRFNTRFSRLIKVPNYVVTQNFDIKFDKRSENILSIGRLEKQKNFEELIKGFSNTDIEIDLIGSGSSEENLKKLAKKYNTKVNFLGTFSNDELLSIYKDYKYYVSTSNFEGNSKTLLEALSSGCIVYVKNIPNNLEIITDKVNGFLYSEKFDYEKFEIIKNYDNSTLEKISNSGVNLINSIYSVDKLLEIEYKNYLSLKK